MTYFNSGYRAQDGLPLANHDDAPYVDQYGTRWEFGRFDPLCALRPRPEFDVPDNPILAALREYDDERNRQVFIDWRDELATLDWSRFQFDPTPDQIAHAPRVLTRIVNVYGEIK